MLDLGAFRRAPLVSAPFKHLVLKRFIRPDQAPAALRDFPEIAHAGLLPVEATRPGPALLALIEELKTPEVTAAFSGKFGIDLTDRPTMITLRHRISAQAKRVIHYA